MPIENRDLKTGTKLVAWYHKQPYACEVTEGEGGRLRYRLADGREFKSPSAAGMAITGKACNGWAFWSLETTEAAPAPDAEKTETMKEPPGEAAGAKDATAEKKETPIEAASATKEPGPAKKRIFRLPNQKGVPQGQTRWYCHDCSRSFLATASETPKACPMGHKVA